MRSRHADMFNHDEDAAGYDADVRVEANPIRTGYDALLDWMAEAVSSVGSGVILDLGVGTGNLTKRLPAASRVVAVDVSERMMAIARDKLRGRDVTFVRSDVLEYFDEPRSTFGGVVSAYTIHHLLAEEKHALFERIAGCLAPGSHVVFGDLMFENDGERDSILSGFRADGRSSLADEIDEEFFWDLAGESAALRAAGFDVETKRFSMLSWGVIATRRST